MGIDPLSRDTIARLAHARGFAAVGIAGIELPQDEERLERWLERGWHGQMEWMQRHGRRRSRPAELVPGTLRVVTVRMDYWPADARDAHAVLGDADTGYVARYALGRDYHKVMRAALQRLAEDIAREIAPHGYRVFVDSGPVLERALAREAGLGWVGKHTNLIAREAGSLFFLGELLTDLPLPVDAPVTSHCGSCSACLPACPTGAIVRPYELDARRCISYLTIELEGAIPHEWRAAIGNRIFGCDDCQLVCPWNRYARAASHPDFKVRHGLDAPDLVELLGWSAQDFEERTRGSAIHRLGYERFLRNVAVALGNALAQAVGANRERITAALRMRLTAASPLVREHVEWALGRAGAPQAGTPHEGSLSGPAPAGCRSDAPVRAAQR